MRILFGGIIFLFVSFVGISAQAQNSWMLYDDFNSEFMDIEKWTTSQRIDTGAMILEYVRELHGGRLHMMSRAFGNTVGSYSGGRLVYVNSLFNKGEVFQGLKVSVKVNEVQATGCPDSNGTPTNARARLVGSFFNAGEITPLPDPPDPPGRTNDVTVMVRINRNSNSTDKPQLLEVVADVFRCIDSPCNNASGLTSVSLGNIMLGQWATIEVDWDGYSRQFNLKLNNEPDIAVPIPGGWAVDPVRIPFNVLGVGSQIANCPANERAMGFIEAEFDNLFVR